MVKRDFDVASCNRSEERERELRRFGVRCQCLLLSQPLPFLQVRFCRISQHGQKQDEAQLLSQVS